MNVLKNVTTKEKRISISCNYQYQRQLFDNIYSQLKYNSLDDFYNLDYKTLRKFGAYSIFNAHKSIYNCVKFIYPEKEWDIYSFNHLPHNYFRNIEKQRHFFETLEKKLNIKSKEEWYSISPRSIKKFKGAVPVLKIYNGSLWKALSSVFPTFNWKITNRKKLPKQYWGSIEDQRKIFDEIYKSRDMISLEDWHLIPKEELKEMGVLSILKQHRRSMNTCLRTLYPNEFNYLMTSHKSLPFNYWNSTENQLKFLEKIKVIYKIESTDDWYKITNKMITQNGGHRLIHMYGSIYRCVRTLYPHLLWDDSKSSIKKYDKNILNSNEKLKIIMNNLIDYFLIRRKEDWYRLSWLQIAKFANIFHTFSGFSKALRTFYPQEKWNNYLLLKRSKKSQQRWLFICLQKKFPNYILVEDYNPPYPFFETGSLIELDIFIPSLNMGIEYNGEQHFDDFPSAFSPSHLYRFRDEEKKKICSNYGLKLVIVPYWWDLSLFSLSSFF